MPDHERSSTNYQRTEDRHLDSHKFENRSDRHDSYVHSHGSFRIAAREERAQSERGRRHSQYDYASNHRYSESEDRLSGSVMNDHHPWTSHDRAKTINSRSHERVDDVFYGRESSNGLRNTTNERRQIRGQDHPKIVHEKRQQWDNNDKHKEEEQEAKSPAACYDVKEARYKVDRGNSGDIDEHMEQQHPYSTDRRHQHGLRHSSSRGRPSSRGSSSHSFSSASDGTDDSRETNMLKEGSSYGRHLSLRDRRHSPSPSGSPSRSESRHSGIRSKSSRSSVKKDKDNSNRSSHGHNKHGSGKRKHRDRSASPDDRKRRKRKEREREKDKEISRERKRDEERRSVLTGKKIKLKVKKDKGDHERDANRKDLLQFLNSAFE